MDARSLNRDIRSSILESLDLVNRVAVCSVSLQTTRFNPYQQQGLPHSEERTHLYNQTWSYLWLEERKVAREIAQAKRDELIRDIFITPNREVPVGDSPSGKKYGFVRQQKLWLLGVIEYSLRHFDTLRLTMPLAYTLDINISEGMDGTREAPLVLLPQWFFPMQSVIAIGDAYRKKHGHKIRTIGRVLLN